jgi:hypothetical protein
VDLRWRVVREWGSTPAERAEPWSCDEWMPGPELVLFRGIDVGAPAPVVFRWLCQLRVAPYSYDVVDNFGRRSPRTLTPGLDQLSVGQTFATMFELVAFVDGEEITLRSKNHLFGDVVMTYRVRPVDGATSRLCVKLLVRHRRDPLGWVWRLVLPEGDLVMMRKQLHTLAGLAEADAA